MQYNVAAPRRARLKFTGVLRKGMLMKALPYPSILRVALSLTLLLSITSAYADIYTDKTTFLQHVQPGYYLETFDELPAFAKITTPYPFSGNGFNYNASAPLELFGIQVSPPSDNALSTNVPQDPLTLTFTSNNVTAVGGNFFLTDHDGHPIPGTVSLMLSDGTHYNVTGSAQSPQPFVGFTTAPNQFITSLTLNTQVSMGWNTVNNLYVGKVVPAPGSLMVFAGTGLTTLSLLLRRRRL
jgi:hypothetical protein